MGVGGFIVDGLDWHFGGGRERYLAEEEQRKINEKLGDKRKEIGFKFGDVLESLSSPSMEDPAKVNFFASRHVLSRAKKAPDFDLAKLSDKEAFEASKEHLIALEYWKTLNLSIRHLAIFTKERARLLIELNENQQLRHSEEFKLNYTAVNKITEELANYLDIYTKEPDFHFYEFARIRRAELDKTAKPNINNLVDKNTIPPFYFVERLLNEYEVSEELKAQLEVKHESVFEQNYGNINKWQPAMLGREL